MTEPKYRVGDVVYILTEWEGRKGDSFVIKKIKTRRGQHFYFEDSPDWNDFYLESFDGWWEENIISEYFPGYGDS